MVLFTLNSGRIVDLENIQSNYDLIRVLETLNPDVRFIYDRTYSWIKVKKGSKIKYPLTFEYNEKNGLNNKHKTKTGWYVSLEVIKI